MALVLTLRGAPGRFCQGSPWFPGSPPLFPWAECHILQHDPACTHQHRDTEPLASWWDQFSFTHEYQVSLIFMLSWKYPSTYCGWGPIKYLYSCYRGFPGGASGKEPACQCRRHKRHRLITGSRRCPGGGHGNPLQFSCLENPMDRGAWQAT